MKCQMKNCERNALLAYGNRWICGYCYMKIREKELEKQNKLMEEIENDTDMSSL